MVKATVCISEAPPQINFFENLTASEEFKRHEAQKKEQRRRAVSKSLVYEQDELDESVEEAGPSSSTRAPRYAWLVQAAHQPTAAWFPAGDLPPESHRQRKAAGVQHPQHTSARDSARARPRAVLAKPLQ